MIIKLTKKEEKWIRAWRLAPGADMTLPQGANRDTDGGNAPMNSGT
jgi:hypothetical protein